VRKEETTRIIIELSWLLSMLGSNRLAIKLMFIAYTWMWKLPTLKFNCKFYTLLSEFTFVFKKGFVHANVKRIFS
jgi:hypothetical protein